MLANRLTLDAQGRLVLRENGKIVLPYEHFANAVMLKHMTGPHGLHLSLEATIRSVVESYTIGRENFGMEKEFIVEVVQSCPNPACRYFKTHLPASQGFMDPATFQAAVGNQPNVDFMQHLSQMSGSQTNTAAMMQPQQPPASSHPTNSNSTSGIIDMTQLDSSPAVKQFSQPMPSPQQAAHQLPHQRSADKQMKYGAAQQHQITAAIIQQQNRAIAQQNLEKFGNMSAMEKQRVLQQLDKKQFDPSLLHADSRSPHDRPTASHLPSRSPQLMTAQSPMDLQQHKANDFSTKPAAEVSLLDSPTNKDLLALHNGAWSAYQPQSVREPPASNHSLHHPMSVSPQQQTAPPQPKQPTNYPPPQPSPAIGQENVVRVFDELMKNMARMKQYIRPSMCKPYGKQSETLQKSEFVQLSSTCFPFFSMSPFQC